MVKSFHCILFLFLPVFRFFLALFFDKEYLRGRHFQGSLAGYAWCFRALWVRNILRLNRTFPFPVGLNTNLSNAKNINFHPDDINNFQSPGLYLQNFSGHITLGHGCYLAPNVGIITANHNLMDLDQHLESKDVIIGEKCWIGMGSIVMPGVVLGKHTIVAAGSVVTKSFHEGYVVLAGSPAKIIRKLNSQGVVK